METCEICKESFLNLKGLSNHITVKHNLLTKEYYDVYIKKENEGSCVICGNETTYRNIGIGYLKNCSIKCRNKNKEIKRDYWKDKTQSKQHVEKRIQNINQELKQINWELSLIKKYGVNNPSKLDSVKNKISINNKGKILNRTVEWQNKIIDTKRKNNNLKHSNETKTKITNSLNEYHKSNFDREKYISKSNNVKHFCGWYNGIYFRSSLELSFLFFNSKLTFISCEKNKFKLIYEKDGKEKVYYPDFTDGEFIYEVKPSKLLHFKDNELKIKKGLEVYGDTYKVITEKDVPYISKIKIVELIDSGIVSVNEKSLKILEKYIY